MRNHAGLRHAEKVVAQCEVVGEEIGLDGFGEGAVLFPDTFDAEWFLLFQYAFQFLIDRMVEKDIPRHEYEVFLLCESGECTCFFRVSGNGLFAEDMFASFKSATGHFCVRDDGCRDCDGGNGGICKDLFDGLMFRFEEGRGAFFRRKAHEIRLCMELAGDVRPPAAGSDKCCLDWVRHRYTMRDTSIEGNMKILLTTGIFFPDVGGPATHVRKIAEHFHSLGWQVSVVAFGDHAGEEKYRVFRASRKYGKLVSWALYALAIARESLTHDVIYAFDLTTAGVPSAFFARLLRKRFLLRIGGDPIWERVVEHGERFLPMRAYYEQGLFKIDKPHLFRTIRRVVQSAETIVTYNEFLKEIYVMHYGVPAERVRIIRNPFPTRAALSRESGTFTFLFAGRFVSYKNLPLVLTAFAGVSEKHPEARLVLIGDGPDRERIAKEAASLGERIEILPKMDQQSLFARIDASSVALAPALSEFNPNFILESLAHGKPAIISRDNGLSVQLPEYLQFDPLDVGSLQAVMESLFDTETYEKALRDVAALPTDQTWEKVVEEHARIAQDGGNVV